MRWILRYLLFITLIIVFSCDKLGVVVNCDDCAASEPKDANLVIRLDAADSDSNATLVQIYEGLLEDNILIDSSYFKGTELSVKVSLNKKYTVTATYKKKNGSDYIAVDSASPRVRYISDQCNNPCYSVYDNKVDLRLKYLK